MRRLEREQEELEAKRFSEEENKRIMEEKAKKKS